MELACYQLASPPGTIRLWIGAHGVTGAPPVDAWRLDGRPLAPAEITTVREMQSVRDETLVTGDPPRAFSGIYEITGLGGSTHSTVELTVGGQPLRRRVKPLPARLELDGPPLTVLLVSCYHHSTDGGLYGERLPRIASGISAPDLCVFMGDQVYLDLPTLQDFHDDPVWLAARFEQDYVRNWFGEAFARGLGQGPLAFLPDDHEYWNNYPHVSPFIQNSWTPAGQGNWRRAAQALYRGFQLGGDGELGDPLELDVEPLSLFLVDSRSERDADLTRLLSARASERLLAWSVRVATDARLVAGVMVTGQSLLETPVGGVKGSIADFALADYEQPYRQLLQAVTAIVEGGKQVLLLTGDVHWGRVSSVRDRQRDRIAMHEIISSPSSLVATVGADQVADVLGTIKGWFGAGTAWHRHSDAKEPPSHLPFSSQRFRTGEWRSHRGNQCLVLRLARRGSGVSVDYTFHPLAGPEHGNVPATTGHLDLLRTS
ncbi:MAG: hypothetical protein ACREM3_01075 [Candidatus Rokuibacteriota bacterium]